MQYQFLSNIFFSGELFDCLFQISQDSDLPKMIRELTVLALLFVFIQADVFRHRRFENIVNERKPGSPNLSKITNW